MIIFLYHTTPKQVMSKYAINDIVLSCCGLQKKLCKYRVIGIQKPIEIDLDDIIRFRYEYNNNKDIESDPYVYELMFHSDQDNISDLTTDEIRMFSHKKDQLTTQIYGKC